MANYQVSSDVDEILKKDSHGEIKEALNLAAFVDNNDTATITTPYASFGDLSGVGNSTYIVLEDSSEAFYVYANTTKFFGGIRLQSGVTVDSIATVISNDDADIPTSGAVVDYVDRHTHAETTPVTVITGTGGETHSRYKTDWLKSEITDIDTSFGTSDIEAVKFGSEVDSIVNTIFKARAGLKLVDFGLIPMVNFEACRNCPDLERVIMRTSNQIGQSAFFDCTSLSDVDLGSVTNIGFNAFKNCTALESITIPDSVTVLGNNVFDGCSSLSEVNCYADESVLDPDNGNVFLGTASPLVIHAKPNTGWTAGTGLSFQGNDNVTVILDLV